MLRRLAKLLAASLLAIPLFAQAAQISLDGSLAGAGNNSTGSFTITDTTPPFLINNPSGGPESRGAVEFDLRNILSAGATITSATFTVRGTVETQKDLSIRLYGGDGVIADVDLELGGPTPFQTVAMTPSSAIQDIVFDISEFLTELEGSYPPFLGVNLRESVSDGGIVVLEYLVLLQIVGLALPEPGSLALLGLGFVGLALSRRRRA